MTAYMIPLTADDWSAIRFAGNRYGWSDVLLRHATEETEPEEANGFALYGLTEPHAWEWRDAVEADMEGGHSAFPLLDPASDLYAKLAATFGEII